ncbi:hypothetical protein OV090_38025 [Nannocystis sp. RBIL2]|uniref:hypothetical protein n=1 Tax=Nannocystis sp. RBIL2 TaxID=2996788 RepID=UPI0022702166|nr:hypothetical protein [Nannocystis sp. RBIL2]MCY1070602.1 hypothetical protein [Nannocystis sp. RBIL2]
MESAPTIPARRSLLDRPQRLGLLPTIWFWNNWDSQRLLLPFVLLFAVPAFLVCDALRMWVGLEPWVSIVPNLVISCLTMGLVERRVRKGARLRRMPDIADAPPPVMHGAQVGRALMLSMAVVSGTLTVLLLLRASFVVLGGAAVGGGVLIAATLWRGTSGARRLASGDESAAPGLPESEQGER